MHPSCMALAGPSAGCAWLRWSSLLPPGRWCPRPGRRSGAPAEQGPRLYFLAFLVGLNLGATGSCPLGVAGAPQPPSGSPALGFRAIVAAALRCCRPCWVHRRMVIGLPCRRRGLFSVGACASAALLARLATEPASGPSPPRSGNTRTPLYLPGQRLGLESTTSSWPGYPAGRGWTWG